MEIPNTVVINNTVLTTEEIVEVYEWYDLPEGRHQPAFRPLFSAWGPAPEDVWRNFQEMSKAGPWLTVVTKEELEGKFHFQQRLLSFASQFSYMSLMLVTKEDICKNVYDRIENRESTTTEELIQLLKNEIAFKEKCKEYVFDKVELYPDMEHYDLDKYQEIVNTYNEIR